MAVARSPFNAVKLELALVVLGAVVVAALSEGLVGGVGSFVMLLIYGVGAGGWIALRSRRVVLRESRQTAGAAMKGSVDVVVDGQEQ